MWRRGRCRTAAVAWRTRLAPRLVTTRASHDRSHPRSMFATSSAPQDPIFWPAHGLGERFLQYARLLKQHGQASERAICRVLRVSFCSASSCSLVLALASARAALSRSKRVPPTFKSAPDHEYDPVCIMTILTNRSSSATPPFGPPWSSPLSTRSTSTRRGATST